MEEIKIEISRVCGKTIVEKIKRYGEIYDIKNV